MSLRVLSRRHVLHAPSIAALRPLAAALPQHLAVPSAFQTRSKWSLQNLNPFRRQRGGGGASTPSSANAASAQQLDDPTVRRETVKTMSSTLSRSIFEDEVASSTPTDGPLLAPSEEASIWATDPDPRARIRWERKKVIQMVRRNGRLTRAERIRMAEREYTAKSHNMATSTKKLMHLAHQIAGKTVDDALVQMQYSKKKYAQEIKVHLEKTRDYAIVERGMGLGQVNGEAGTEAETRHVVTKKGKRLTVTDPTRMYIAQAWVGKGPLRGVSIDYKGRGRFGKFKHRSSSITVVLKEEKTRVREHDERKAKEDKKKPWVHLPDRPVTAQRPYYSW